MPFTRDPQWDEYYRSGVEVDFPELAQFGQELRRWFETVLPADRRKVLEAGCGSGAQSLVLAQGGFEVNLLDSSQEALGAARDLLGKYNIPANYYHGDAFDPGPAEFDLVF